jgi:hypothetical protein
MISAVSLAIVERRPSKCSLCDGISIALWPRMTPTRHNVRTTSSPMIRWILRRDSRAITCELDRRSDRSYEVCVMPHWDPSAAMIERFDAATPALLRHADVARRLREHGWTVTDHMAAVHAAA